MGDEWREVALSELYEYRSGLSKPRSEFGSGFPFLTFREVFNNTFVPESLSELVQSTKRERESCSVRRGDVFLTRTSETMDELGMSCVALKDYDSATFNGFCKRLRPRPNVDIVPEYAAYYFRSPRFRRAVTAMASLSTRASLNNDMLDSLTMLLPPHAEQKAIAATLKPLDDKIELNRKMNQTLEEMARAIFKSWFVDFDPVRAKAEGRQPIGMDADTAALFPNGFEESELGKIPKGWKLEPCGQHIELAYGKSLPKKERRAGPYPVIGSGGKDGTHDIALVSGPGVVVGRKGTVGTIHWVDEDFYPIDTTFFVRPKGALPILWVFEMLRQMDIAHLGADSAVPGVNRHAVYAEPWVVPPLGLAQIFRDLSTCLFNRRKAAKAEAEILARLRDLLLPKLLSGEIRVGEAEKLVEAAS